MKVSFVSTFEDSIDVTEKLQKRHKRRSSNFWQRIYTFYFYANILAVPALLLFFDYIFIGLVLFFISLMMFIFLLPIAEKDNLRDYYKSIFSKDDEQTEIELSEKGIGYKRENGMEWFWTWNNIVNIEDTDRTIYFFTRGRGISVPKRAFNSGEQIREFLTFANSRIKTEDGIKNA